MYLRRGTFFLLLLKIYVLVPGFSASDTATDPIGIGFLNKLLDMKERALNWLSLKRKSDFGWGSETSQVIIALSAAVDGWPQKNDEDAMLIAKQLEVELLGKLLRYPLEPIPTARLAYYALALKSICKDPRDYYGHNLIGMLKEHTSEKEFPGYPRMFGFSLSSLVSCLGGGHIHRRQIHHLIKICLDDTGAYPIETQGMALLGLKCIYKWKELKSIHRALVEGYETLGGLQKLDGSFGNIHRTALIIQGLGFDENFGEFWNETSGILGLGAAQNPDGSFEDNVLGTADALLAISTLLKGSGILKLRRNQCSLYSYQPLDELYTAGIGFEPISQASTTYVHTTERPMVSGTENDTPKGPTISGSLPGIERRDLSSNTPPMSPASQVSIETASQSPTISVKYSLWIGPDPLTAEKHNLTITVVSNTSFFHLMQRAAELDPAFEFSSTVWPNGHYVHTISGHREQPVGYNYWLLYRLPTDPDPENPPPTTYVAEKGVDDLILQNGEIYLFWFKKI